MLSGKGFARGGCHENCRAALPVGGGTGGRAVTTEPEDAPLACRRCGAELRPGSGDFYRVTVEAVADPSPPDVSAEDLARDLRREIEQLLDRLRGLSEQEALDQVYRRLTFHLCGPCYRHWIRDPTG
jgi:hypothetical protein